MPPPVRAPHRLAWRRWWPWLLSLAMVVGIVLAFGALSRRTPAPLGVAPKTLANVAAERIVREPYWDSLELPARLQADRAAVVSSELPGRLESWEVSEGATVKAGAAIARLNDDDLRARLAQAEAGRHSASQAVLVAAEGVAAAGVGLTQAERDAAALRLELASAQATLTLAEREFDRVRSLAAADISTRSDLDRAENAVTQARLGVARAEDAMARAAVGVAAARSRVAQSEAAHLLAQAQGQEIDRQLDAIRLDLGKTVIRAPFDGAFEAHLAQPGDVVAPGQPLGRFYDQTHLRVAVDVPDRFVPFLDSGNPILQTYLAAAMPGAIQDVKAAVIIPGMPKLTGGFNEGVELAADVHRIALAGNPLSNTFRVDLRFPNPGGALKEGIIVRARVTLLRHDNAIVIPLRAIQVTEKGTRVLIIAEREGRTLAQVRAVDPIAISGDRILVRGELEAGDLLVVSGSKGVLDGEEVNLLMVDGVFTAASRSAAAAAGERP